MSGENEVGKCVECDQEVVHIFRPVKAKVKIPLCDACWKVLMRRLKDSDSERLEYRADMIKREWATQRRNGNRAKFRDEHLDRTLQMKINGMGVCAIAKELGMAQSLVHRYLTKLTAVE